MLTKLCPEGDHFDVDFFAPFVGFFVVTRFVGFFVVARFVGFFVVARFFAGFFADFFADFFAADFFAGTFPPARRASESPMAIACLRLVTFLPDLPLRNVPVFRSCITFLTFDCAFAPYFAMFSSSVDGPAGRLRVVTAM